MFKNILSFLLIILLSACGVSESATAPSDIPNNPVMGADGYIFGKTEYESHSFHVNIITYKNRTTFMNAAQQFNVDSERLVAFTVSNENTCTMHIMDPRVKYQPEYVGHEFLHCMYGQWHTDNEHRS